MRVLAVLGLFAVALAGAQPPAASREAYDRITHRLIAPCCWSEAVADHRSPAAEEVRRRVAAELRAGAGEDEIVAGLVADYGERILIVPEGRKADLLFWTPVLVFALAFAYAAIRLVRLLRRAPALSGITPGLEVDDADLDW